MMSCHFNTLGKSKGHYDEWNRPGPESRVTHDRSTMGYVENFPTILETK